MRPTKENPVQLVEGITLACVIPSVPEPMTREWIANLTRDIPYIKNMIYYRSIEDIFPKFSEPSYHADYIVLDIDDLHSHQGANFFELIKTLKTLINCTVRRDSIGQMVRRDTKLICLAGENTPADLIRESAGLVTYVGIRTGLEAKIWTYEDIKSDIIDFTHGHTGIAKKLLNHIKTEKKKVTKITLKKNEIQLTPRQRQIFNLISTRGASNKSIARMLDISESTVKLHTSAILKKYGVKNRTQLAVFSREREPI